MNSFSCGIVTLYHDNFNYGGLLQAFALQRVISKYCEKTELVTFDIVSAAHFKKRLAHFSNRQARDALLQKMRTFFSGKKGKAAIEDRKNAFRQFEAAIPHSNLVAPKGLQSFSRRYSVLVVGSDQVWNPAWWNDILLLRGVDGRSTRKISYAASMGCSSLSPSDAAIFKSSIEDFDAVSMREPSGARLVEEVTNGSVKAEVSLDPTLLLSKAEWLDAIPRIASYRIPSQPFALLYLVDKFRRYTDESIRSCLSAGLQCVVVSYSMEKRAPIDGAIYLSDCTPQEWIHLVNEASVVVTDSFHGIAFSANFNKPFWCFRKTETLNGSHLDDRQEALLSRLGLASRIIDADEKLDIESLTCQPDFDVCNKQLERERRESIEYLKRNLCADRD